jgi:hypothetical protein
LDFLGNIGVADGTRTHDDRNHNPGLYQLSYSHHWDICLAHQELACRSRSEIIQTGFLFA